MALRLRPFQREDVDSIKRAKLRVLLASSPGTGKSCIAATSILETGHWSLPALVVCPSSVTLNWAKEMKLWAPGLKSHVIEKTNGPIPDADVYIIGWALLEPRLMSLMTLNLQCVVADEAHFVKNPDALRSTALYQLTRNVKGIMLLTGTPLINRVDEMQVLESLFTKTPLMIRRLITDVAPEIPPKSRSYLFVQMRDKAQHEYDRAVDDFESWLRRKKEALLGEGMAEDAVARAMAAEFFTKFGYLRRLVGESKVPAAADFVARLTRIGEPLVIFSEHQDVIVPLSESLRKQRIRHEVLDGGTSTKKRQKFVDNFQANKFPVLICSSAGSEGITLHAARNMLVLERGLTSAVEEQREDRIRRIGQKFATTIWIMQVINTIDDRLDQIIRTKRLIIREALRSENTAETEEDNVEALVKSWDSFVQGGAATGPEHVDRKVSDLGRGDPLPPLPSPAQAHAVVFSGERWNSRAATRWCRMQGYLPEKRVNMQNRFKIIIHPIELFKSHEFTIFKVCSDVKVILGKRLTAANEAVVRRKLNANRPERDSPAP